MEFSTLQEQMLNKACLSARSHVLSVT